MEEDICALHCGQLDYQHLLKLHHGNIITASLRTIATVFFTVSTASYNSAELQIPEEKVSAAHTSAFCPPGVDASIFYEKCEHAPEELQMQDNSENQHETRRSQKLNTTGWQNKKWPVLHIYILNLYQNTKHFGTYFAILNSIPFNEKKDFWKWENMSYYWVYANAYTHLKEENINWQEHQTLLSKYKKYTWNQNVRIHEFYCKISSKTCFDRHFYCNNCLKIAGVDIEVTTADKPYYYL